LAEKEGQANQFIYVVLNPIAGNSSAEQIRQALEEAFGKTGWTLDIHETTGKEDVSELTRAACERGAAMVVAAGGDGTVGGVVNGLVNRGIPLGILPVGTGNGLARALGVPIDLENAVALLAGDHDIIDLDALQVGDTYYILKVSAGLSARVMRDTPPEEKRRFGIAAYLRTTISQIMGFQPRQFVLNLDGHPAQVRASEILVSNNALLKEPPFPLGPREKLNDGVFDVYIITAQNLGDYLRIVWGLVFNRSGRKKELRTLTVKNCVSIRGVHREYTVQADGEVIGLTPVEVNVAPSAVKAIAPKEEE
jgi:YegS/Rv2252/BmrU family lipid kinase